MKKLVFLVILITTSLNLHSKPSKTSTTLNKTIVQDNAIIVYSSTSNDLEDEVRILKTTNELTHHIFDFNKNTITMVTYKGDDTISVEFKITRARILSNNIKEFDIDNKACRQVWVSGIGNIGYEFNNGQTLVFYGIKQIQ